MVSRRSVVRQTAGVGAGLLALFGQATARESRDGRKKGEMGPAARSVTAVTATGNRTAIRASRRPNQSGPLVNALDSRLETVSIEHCTGVGGRGAVNGPRLVAGSAVVTGRFEGDEVRQECRSRYTAADGSQSGAERFLTDDGVAIAPTDGAVVVGYAGQDRDGALARIDRELDDRPTRDPSTRHGTGLASALDGDAVVTAALGETTRRYLREAATGAAGPLPAVVDAAAELGVAVTVDDPDRASVTYGVVADSEALSTETVRSVIREADTGSDTVDTVRLARSGRTVLVDATLPIERAFEAQAAAVGHETSIDDRN